MTERAGHGIYGLIDLHLHLDGSISFASARSLAARCGVSLPESDAALARRMRVPENCRDLNEYLKMFALPLSLLQTEETLATAVETLCRELSAQGLIYAEIRFAPQLHTQKGLSQESVVRAAIQGLKRAALPAKLILCCMRGRGNEKENLETAALTKAYVGRGVAAADLAGAEALYPNEEFAYLFDAFHRENIPFTLHSGEAAGAESVWSALRFGAKRIGHGVRCYTDAALVRELAKTGVFLELCPTSNLDTRIFADIAEYPLRALMDAGVRATVNSDNMTVSNTSVGRDMALIADAFHLTKNDIKTLLLNAADASFTDETEKADLRAQVLAALE